MWLRRNVLCIDICFYSTILRLPSTSHRNRLTPAAPRQPSAPTSVEPSAPPAYLKCEEALPPPPSYSRCQFSTSLQSLSSLRPPSSTGAPPAYEEAALDSDDELIEDEFEVFARVGNPSSGRRCSAPFGLQEASTSGQYNKNGYRGRLHSDLTERPMLRHSENPTRNML